jgi:hypothetical protein
LKTPAFPWKHSMFAAVQWMHIKTANLIDNFKNKTHFGLTLH